MQNLLNSVSDIENLIAQLNQRKTELIEEQNKQFIEEQKTNLNEIENDFISRWNQIELARTTKFNSDLMKFRSIIALEAAILESIKNFVSPEMYDKIEDVLAKVRESNNNFQLLGLYGKSCRQDVILRQVMKFISAVYRYNQQLILFKRKDSSAASEIKYATLCLHCGEIAKQILHDMMITGAVSLP